MSESDGALDAVEPVAAHMPGGGVASMIFMLAARSLLEAVEALVDVLRLEVGESAVGLDASGSRVPWGCGKGTGVDTLSGLFASGEAMAVGWRGKVVTAPLLYEIGRRCLRGACCQAKLVQTLNWVCHCALARSLTLAP